MLLWLLYEAGVLIAHVSCLPLPPNLVGLLLLLVLLEVGVVPDTAMAETATFVSHHLNFFFVPFIVGIMAWSSLLAASGVLLGISLIGSAVLGILATGCLMQWLERRHA
jgi:holin-like protein